MKMLDVSSKNIPKPNDGVNLKKKDKTDNFLIRISLS